MTIRSFFRSLNVFATIANLRADNAFLKTSRDSWGDAYFSVLGRFADASSERASEIAKLRQRLAAHSQAVEAFMVERESFKEMETVADAYIDWQAQTIADLRRQLDFQDGLAHEFLRAADEGIAELRAQAAEQASEILEVVSYVKSCEAALAGIGVTIEDTDDRGPAIMVDGSVFVPAMEDSIAISGDVRMVVAA